MNSPEIKLNTILKKIRTYESGPSVDGMKRLGLNYHKNFGVSLINLKKIAGQYHPNHELAKLLRTKNFLIIHPFFPTKNSLKNNLWWDIFPTLLVLCSPHAL